MTKFQFFKLSLSAHILWICAWGFLALVEESRHHALPFLLMFLGAPCVYGTVISFSMIKSALQKPVDYSAEKEF